MEKKTRSKKPPSGKDWEFKISRRFLDRPDLTANAKWIAVCLRGWANRDGFATPTLPQIAKRSGLHIETVVKYLAELKSKEVIEWIEFRERGHKRRRYFLGSKMPISMGDATPLGPWGATPPKNKYQFNNMPDHPLNGHAVNEPSETLYDYDLNFTPRRQL